MNVHRSSCQVPIILVRFQSNLNFLDTFSKNTQMSSFMTVCKMSGFLCEVDENCCLLGYYAA